MKRTFLLSALACLFALVAFAQGEEQYADIQFDKLSYDFGTFSEKDGSQSCTFTFTNTGNAPLVINQAYASCGCTVATYTKDPVQPGESGTVEVTYNGKGKTAGHFKKTISIRSNAKKEVVRLSIEGTMTTDKK